MIEVYQPHFIKPGVAMMMMISYLFRLGKPLFAAANTANSATKYTALTGGNDMQLHDILLVLYVICKLEEL